MSQKAWEIQYEAIMADPAASWWLKGCLNGAIQYRDPVDVMNDLECMQGILQAWMEGIKEDLRNYPLILHTPRAHSAGRFHLPGLPGGL